MGRGNCESREMKTHHFLAALLFSATLTQSAEPAPDQKQPEDRFVQLQLFLDRENFNPGVIDGFWGEFTRKALERYLSAQGQPDAGLSEQPPQKLPVPLDQGKEMLTSYTITGDDTARIGSVASSPAAQAKQKSMPYESLLELVGEKFHADRELLRHLNPGVELGALKEGDAVKVPNVANPFEIGAVEKLQEQKKKDAAEDEHAENPKAETKRIRIDVDARILELSEDGKLIATFPFTPGSDSLPAPKGEWKVESITWLPWFRYDEKMLNEGVRSDDAHNIPPGPNNAVGIVWMALNKIGIGLHGTSAPETIGRSASHGCIRLANWDAFKLGGMIAPGISVTIE